MSTKNIEKINFREYKNILCLSPKSKFNNKIKKALYYLFYLVSVTQFNIETCLMGDRHFCN